MQDVKLVDFGFWVNPHAAALVLGVVVACATLVAWWFWKGKRA